jgi:hypothetical protein
VAQPPASSPSCQGPGIGSEDEAEEDDDDESGKEDADNNGEYEDEHAGRVEMEVSPDVASPLSSQQDTKGGEADLGDGKVSDLHLNASY